MSERKDLPGSELLHYRAALAALDDARRKVAAAAELVREHDGWLAEELEASAETVAGWANHVKWQVEEKVDPRPELVQCPRCGCVRWSSEEHSQAHCEELHASGRRPAAVYRPRGSE